RRNAALDTSLHGFNYLRIVEQVVVRFGTVERQRLELFVLPPPGCEGGRDFVSVEFLARVHGGEFRKPAGMDVIAAAADVVVRVPRSGGSQNRDLRLGRRGGHHPRKGKRLAGGCSCPQIIQSRSVRRYNGWRRRKPTLVPAHSGLREIAIGQCLSIGIRTVLIHPANHSDELLL